MINATLQKFSYPQTLIKSYSCWNLLLRPGQPTLGSLVLVCKESVYHYADISLSAMSEQKLIIGEIEAILKHRFNYTKINYLMLMMVDPIVHMHIIPRYENKIEFCGKEYDDHNWPSAPDLSHDIGISDVYIQELLKTLITDFSSFPSNIVSTKKEYNRIFTSGSFDIFHQGHLNIIKKSKALCHHLIVGVSTDEVILKAKGRLPIIPFQERISILESNRYIDEVIPQVDKNKQKIVDEYNIDAISVGSDWKGKYPKVTCDMVYFDYTPNVSSTVLKQKLNITGTN